MITHIVLFKLKDKSPENIEKARDVLSSMKVKIPQLRHLEVGTDVLRSERSYDIALVTKFDSLEGLTAYQSHPIHVEVAKFMISIRESSITVDYESK
ncbi:MAG: Dabb family protein [Candidatus Methanoperedens sp.]|nr:Dabb family protein [Candidatus Methanoperedens sp.]